MNFWMARRKIHVSWHIAVLSVGIVTGMVAVQYIDQSFFVSSIWLAVAIVMLVIVFWRKSAYLIFFALLGGLLIGLWRGSIEQHTLQPYKNIIGKSVVLSGTVSDDADISKNGAMLLRLENIKINDQSISGKIWVSTTTKLDIKRSDIVVVKGKLGPGFGSFSGAMYNSQILTAQHPQPGDVALGVRDWFADAIRTAIPEPQASLGIGYLVGQRRALPPELVTALQTVGLTHIIVASGYNLTILVRLARRSFEKVSKYLSVLSATVMIVGFVAISGLSASMNRAGLIAGLGLLAWYYGRKFHPLVLLPFAAAITVLINPSFAWNDLGWQLSFAAFAGVMIVAPLLQAYFFGKEKPGIIRQILGETISAQLVTLPILVFAFGQFSNVAIIANLLVLPLVPLAMLLTFIAGLAAIAVPAIATIVALPATWLLQYMVGVATYFASLPWALSEMQIQWWHVVLAYLCIVAACLYMWRKTGYNLRDSNLVE